MLRPCTDRRCRGQRAQGDNRHPGVLHPVFPFVLSLVIAVTMPGPDPNSRRETSNGSGRWHYLCEHENPNHSVLESTRTREREGNTMSFRSFTDSAGNEWQAFDVVPRDRERRV